MKTARTVFLLLATAFFFFGPVHAHQQKLAITRLVFNERSGSLEVMHRFYLHDAEHAVRQLFDTTADILATEETRVRFGHYVSELFQLRDESGQIIALDFVGQEIEGNHIWVYQEHSPLENWQALSVRHGALREIWPEQTNMVNIEYKAGIRTLTFFESIDELSLTLRAPDGHQTPE
ncbi:MAG: hypothetical protein RQ757_00115 [Pseudomonadales bacterium]|nr:hypothetical protein [Pseudomonadales bacterium]